MKRYFGIGAALAGILALGLAACTDGNGDFVPEIPTNYGEVDANYSGSGVEATWDFTGLSNDSTPNDNEWGLANTEAPFPEKGLDENGSIKVDGTSAKGATLVPFGSWRAGNQGLQGKKNTITISDVSSSAQKNAPGFKLTLKEQANIVIVARGAGAAEAARFLVIFDKNNNKLAYKDKLASGASNDVTFTVKGATPESGPYTIVANGAGIQSIDLSSASTNLEKPSEITNLMIDKLQDDIESFEAYETLQLNILGDDGKTKDEKMTKDAVWTSSNEKVATVKEGLVTGVGAGTAVIRARIGRFYTKRTVTVTPSTKTLITFIDGDKLPAVDVVYVNKDATTGKTVTGFLALPEMEPLLKPTVKGVFATAGNATLEFDKGFGFLSDGNARAGIYKKGDTTSGDASYGVYWRSASYSPAASSSNPINEATFTFKVSPAVGRTSVKLAKLTALTRSNKGANNHKLRVNIGEDVFEQGIANTTATTEISLNDYEITEETEVKVTVVVQTNDTRTALQDLTLVVAE